MRLAHRRGKACAVVGGEEDVVGGVVKHGEPAGRGLEDFEFGGGERIVAVEPRGRRIRRDWPRARGDAGRKAEEVEIIGIAQGGE